MWDGVFTSVMVNIFSVIIFLRSGWVVAQAGIGLSVLMVFCTGNYPLWLFISHLQTHNTHFYTVGIVLVSVLSAIGICERCKVESGGVYFLLSYVLGSRIAAAVGLLYCFGQVGRCNSCIHCINNDTVFWLLGSRRGFMFDGICWISSKFD